MRTRTSRNYSNSHRLFQQHNNILANIIIPSPSLVIGVIVAVWGRRGGNREARGIPGRGEEDRYQGRKVQGGVDEAQRGREEEEGGSGGGWARDGVPGAGGELRRGGRRRWPGTGQPRGGCPPVAFRRGGSLLPPLIDCRVPVDGDGSDCGD